MDQARQRRSALRTVPALLSAATCALALAVLASAAGAHGQVQETPAPPDAAQLALGKSIAVRDCSSCHAIGEIGSSPLKEAPKFRELYRQFDVGDLSEALAEGIVVGHGPMPVWVYEPDEVAALVSYLKSLEPPVKP
ncbi:MAG: cytochrome c [Caulobacter sp.]|nr:cytochrome c [Caulobacter sp.]